MGERDTVTRRSVLIGASAGAGGIVLAACSSSSGASTGTRARESTTGPATSGAAGGGDYVAKSPAATSPAATSEAHTPVHALVALADVPVGGAVAAVGAGNVKLLISQPTKGQVVAFNATCTHMGCPVAPGKTSLNCPCHGSTYDLATGVPTRGPATHPLAKVPVTVVNGQVVPA